MTGCRLPGRCWIRCSPLTYIFQFNHIQRHFFDFLQQFGPDLADGDAFLFDFLNSGIQGEDIDQNPIVSTYLP